MQLPNIRGWTTFRRRVALAAAVGLAVVAAMAAILVGTARSARAVVEAAQASHLRIATFSRLQFAADHYQRANYEVLRWNTPEALRERGVAGDAFDRAIRSVAELPGGPREARANREVLRLSAEVQRLLGGLPDIVARVNEQWRLRGSTAAMREIEKQSHSYFELTDTLRREVEASDVALRSANERALTIQRAVLPSAAAALILAFMSAAVGSLLILLRLGPSLRRLEAGAIAFAEGRMEHRIPVSGRDEFTRLCIAFNGMAEQITVQQQRLRDAASGLEAAVVERTSDLEAANAALAAADQRRRTFFAEVSHELRTPLTIIQGEAQVALRQLDPEVVDVAESFERISQQARQLGRLIQDLFLIARAEADGLDLLLAHVDVGQLLSRVADDFKAITSDSGMTIRAAGDAGLVIAADVGRLRQVLSAALDNAIRHAGAGVTVDLLARRAGDTIEIVVADDGPGVDPALLDALLLRFRRGASPSEGSGLGLTIVRALIQAHGGSVALANRATGGLELLIRLPTSAAMTAQGEVSSVGTLTGRGRGESRALRATGS
jgi:signal transduction histidine kinase